MNGVRRSGPPPNVIAYKFQSPDGSYWYICADDQRTLDYWRDKRKLIPLTDDKARVAAGVVSETSDLPPLPTHVGEEYHGPSQSPVKLYDADQMHAYAQDYGRARAAAAVLAERERCAKLCDRTGNDHCAAAIRAEPKEQQP